MVNVGDKFYKKDYVSKTDYESELLKINNQCLRNGMRLSSNSDENGDYMEIVILSEEDYFKNLKLYKLSDLSDSFRKRITDFIITDNGYKLSFALQNITSTEVQIHVLENVIGESTGYLVQYDGTLIENVPLKDIKHVYDELCQAYSECYKHRYELQKLINDCTTKEQLDDIEISWPV